MWVPIAYSFGEQAVQSEHNNHDETSKREHFLGMDEKYKELF